MRSEKGYQAIRAHLALDLCEVVFDLAVDKDNEEIAELKQLIKECKEELTVKLGAGARRTYLSRLNFLQTYIIEEVTDDIYVYWAYLVYACADLLFDCKIGAPLYFTKSFSRLLDIVLSVQTNLCEDIIGLEEEGTKLYLGLSIE